MKNRHFPRPNSSRRVNRKLFDVNPTLPPVREATEKANITIYSYNHAELEIREHASVSDCKNLLQTDRYHWIDVAGLRKDVVNEIASSFDIHPLWTEDILTVGQRPKMDEAETQMYALLYMMYFNSSSSSVESEQVSLIMGSNFVISFQEDARRDLFDPVRKRLMQKDSRLRTFSQAYLFYSLIDIIVDNYFLILESLGETIESLEDEIIRNATTVTLGKINQIRKEMILLKRHVAPVRELVNGIIRSDMEWFDDRTQRYLKDVYDHIVQASELSENYRDMVLNLHDLYLSELNLRMNEVMKVMAVVTCLLAPATVIGGIFGMNFNRMPWLQNDLGFYLAVGAMLLIPVGMIYIFRRRGWF